MTDKSVSALALCIQAGTPAIIIGEPGTAKTATINAICRSIARHRGKPFPCKTIIAAIHEPQDIGGFGVPTRDAQGRDVIKLLPVGGWLTELLDAGQGVLNMDELTCVPAMMQAACLRVFGEKVFGEISLPEGIVPVAAANPIEQAAGGQLIAPPLANRVIWLDWAHDTEKVIAGFLGGWQDPDVPLIPANWKEFIPEQAALAASFFKRFPHHMQQLPKDEDKRSGPWPSIRSWYDLGVRSMAAAESVHAGWDMKLLLLSGAVGHGTASEFITWVKSLDLPDPEELLKDYKKFKVFADRPDKTFAVLNSVVAAATRDLTPARWEAAWRVLASAAKSNAVDIAGAAASALARAREGKSLPLINELIEPFHPILTAQRKLRQQMAGGKAA
jgi:hypothetical protein